MANHLPRDKKLQVLNLLVEGMSVRATARVAGVQKGTILKLLKRVGDGCRRLHDRLVRNLRCRQIQADEIWGYVHTKQGHLKDDSPRDFGDSYTFVGIDRETKLIASYLVGKRDGWNADSFMLDLSARLAPGVRPQLSSDGFDAYPRAVEGAFGCDVDYGIVVKDYGVEDAGRGRYSPPKVLSVEKFIITGRPDEDEINTSHVERQNLTMRMCMRRLTRLTNAFSKKLDNLKAAVALHFAWYNFVRVHATVRVTPAMEAGITDRLWTLGDLLDAALDPMHAEPVH